MTRLPNEYALKMDGAKACHLYLIIYLLCVCMNHSTTMSIITLVIYYNVCNHTHTLQSI